MNCLSQVHIHNLNVMHETDTMQALCWNAVLEGLLFATSPAVENIDSTCTEAVNYVFLADFTWRKLGELAAYRVFGGFSADENSAANTANGVGLGVYTYASIARFVSDSWTSLLIFWSHVVDLADHLSSGYSASSVNKTSALRHRYRCVT